MRKSTCPIAILCATVAWGPIVATNAAVVVTQSEERAMFGLWLLSDWAQQDIAHRQIWAIHDVSAVEVFSDETLVGVDMVYVSPSLGELVLTTEEIDALENFVLAGGRMIIPRDYGMFAEDIVELAARFGVEYGPGFINGIYVAEVLDFDNPIINGPAGTVNSYSGASPNESMNSTNENFRVLATWQEGSNALGYIEHGKGEVIFLSDFNTWDNDMIDHLDNQILWINLFGIGCDPCFCRRDPRWVCDGDVDGDARVNPVDSGLVQAAFCAAGECDGSDLCQYDMDCDGQINPVDAGIVQSLFGTCERARPVCP